MLLPISGGGKRGAKETAKPEPKKAEKPARTTAARSKKAEASGGNGDYGERDDAVVDAVRRADRAEKGAANSPRCSRPPITS